MGQSRRRPVIAALEQGRDLGGPSVAVRLNATILLTPSGKRRYSLAHSFGGDNIMRRTVYSVCAVLLVVVGVGSRLAEGLRRQDGSCWH